MDAAVQGLWIAATLAWVGCQPAPSTPATDGPAMTGDRPTIRVLVIADPELTRVLEREWNARGGDPLTIRQLSQEEFLGQEQRRLASDVVIFPSPLLGELAGRDWLQPLEEKDLSDPRFERRDIWDLIRLRETAWGEQTVAVPLGSPTFVLCYRRDIFSRMGLKPPTTWAEYRALAEQLSDRKVLGEAEGKEQPWSGSCEPLGNGWAAECLLAHAASSARHRSQFSTLFDFSDMRPLVDGPPFVRALEELVALMPYFPGDAAQLDPAGVRRYFNQGHCAMAITWQSAGEGRSSSAAAGESGQTAATAGGSPSGDGTRRGRDDPSPTLGQLDAGFVPLPGSREVYNYRTKAWDQRLPDESPHVPLIGFSGRLAAITTECRQPAASANLLFFLSGMQEGGRVAAASRHTTLFRESQLAQADQWISSQFGQEQAQQYADTLKRIFQESTCLTTLRIPARQRYLAALDAGVQAAIARTKSPAEALGEVARQWDEITDAVGRDAQRRAYVQSIGLQPSAAHRAP